MHVDWRRPVQVAILQTATYIGHERGGTRFILRFPQPPWWWPVLDASAPARLRRRRARRACIDRVSCTTPCLDFDETVDDARRRRLYSAKRINAAAAAAAARTLAGGCVCMHQTRSTVFPMPHSRRFRLKSQEDLTVAEGPRDALRLPHICTRNRICKWLQ